MPEQSLSAAEVVEDAIARTEAIRDEYQEMINRAEKWAKKDKWIRRGALFFATANLAFCVYWFIKLC